MGGTAAVGVFCFDDNDAMTQFQFELSFPTVELEFWRPEISWKPSTLAVTLGAPLGEETIAFAHFYKISQNAVNRFHGHSSVTGCPDVCEP